MQKDDTVYLGHMLDMARKVSVRVAGRSKTDYEADEDLRFVIAHLIQTIGEAAARVSIPTQKAHPEIPWKNITGIRHRIVHDYMGGLRHSLGSGNAPHSPTDCNPRSDPTPGGTVIMARSKTEGTTQVESLRHHSSLGDRIPE